MKVIVTGSLGNISLPMAEELIKKGHTVTVISSKAGKQKDIEALGATAAIGTVQNVEFLTAAFAGADAVYAMIPPDFSQPDQLAYYRSIGSNYARAIEQSGVKRLVHLSSMGAHLNKGTGIILGSHYTEGILNELPDIAIVHLRPTYFYTNLSGFADMISHQGIIGANYGGNDKIAMVHPSDIAAAAVEAITAETAGKTVRYIGSDDVTANEAARILGTAIGKPDLTWVTFTDDEMQSGLEKRGVPPALATGIVEIGAGIRNGALRQHYDQQQPINLGRVKLEDFAKEFAAAFKKR